MMTTQVGTVAAQHGRNIRSGQIWRSNDPSRLRGIRVLGFHVSAASIGIYVEDIIRGTHGILPVRAFTVGPAGWSLEKEAA